LSDSTRKIQIGYHAKIRMLERNISEEDIERIINNPIQTVYDEYEENYKSYGLVYDKYNKDNKLFLLIVHTDLRQDLNSNPVKIITAMYVNKGGLKRWFQ